MPSRDVYVCLRVRVALLGVLFDGVEDYLADSRLVELDKCSHWVQHDASPALNKELSAFLVELEATKKK